MMGKFSQQIRWDITRSVTLASLFYFLYHAGKACLFPFLTLYFRQLGLTATQSGIVSGSKALMWLLAAPIWTVMAKRFGKTKIILGTALLAMIASNLSLTIVSPADEKQFFSDCHSSSIVEVDQEVGNILLPTKEPSIQPSTTLFVSTAGNSHPTVVSQDKSRSRVNLTALKEGEVTSTTTSSLTSTSIALKQITAGLITKSSVTATTATSSATTTSLKTTTSQPSSTTTTVSASLSPSEMASHLLPRIIEADPQEPKDVESLLSQYHETRNWPRWKLRILTRRIIDLLDQQDEKRATVRFITDLDKTSKRKPTPPNLTTTSSVDATVKKIARKLKPIYRKQKAFQPLLTVSEFVDSYPQLSVLPQDAKEVIAGYMNDLLIDSVPQVNSSFADATSRKKRNLADENSLQINVTNISNASIQNSDAGMADTSSHLIGDLIPRITDHVFTFVIVLVIVIAGEMVSAPIELLSDNSFHELLDELDSLNRYGEHKIAAIIGVMITGISVSTAVYFSPCYLAGNISRFSLYFYSFAGVIGMAFLIVPFYPMYLERANQRPRTHTVSLCPACHAKLCVDCRRILLLFTMLLVGVVQAGLQDFLFWELQNLPGASELVYGAYVSVNAFTALLAVPLGRRMTSSLRVTITVPISLLSIAAQLLIYSFIGKAWMALPAQVLNIFGIPFLWMIVSSELKTLMTWQDENTSLRALDQVHVFARSSQKRAIYIAYLCVYQGIAFALGSVITGVSFDASGGSLLPFLRVAASLLTAWALFYLVVQCFCVRKPKHRRYSKLLDDSDDEVETFNLKDRNASCAIGFPKRKSGRIENGRRIGESRKKKRTKVFEELTSSSEEDELEREWVSMNTKKSSNHI